MRIIRKFAREVAERFEPEKIILFGSYAYGTPNDDSDVDILVVMACRNQHDQAVKIRLEIARNFAMDVLWNNQVVASFSSIHGGSNGANMNWQLRSVDVLAQAGINRLEFRATTGLNARGAAIDDVTMNLIPAPNTSIALVAGGLAAVRRRR